MRQKILFLTPYPANTAASQRFRFEQYYKLLRQNGFEITIRSFLDNDTWCILYKPGHYFKKVKGIVWGFINRIMILGSILRFDYVFIHREAAPLGPPFIEWIIIRVFRRKVVFDFDDAIWLNKTSDSNRIINKFRFNSKIDFIFRNAYKVSAANSKLSEYALTFNSNVIINPTTLDTEDHHNRIKKHTSKRPTIGWTGTHSTLKYIEILIPVLNKLRLRHDFDFVIISDQDPNFQNLEYNFIQWKADGEIDDLLRMDIGIMPLYDDEWSRGKSGFKALQYMALGIPAVASNVGFNLQLIESGVSGYLCQTEEDWENALANLIVSHEQREILGRNGRTFVEKYFSVRSNAPNFLSLFQ